MSTQSIFPALRYRDAAAAIEWLRKAFGFEEEVHRGDDGSVQHAELRLAGNLVMVGQHSDDGWMEGRPPDALASTISLYAVVSDPDAHHRVAVAAGAKVVRELDDRSTDHASTAPAISRAICGRSGPTIPMPGAERGPARLIDCRICQG